MTQTKTYTKYVSQNILGQLGVSCYILADTFFISQAAGADGITVLNLCLPLYNLIFAVGSMLGLGSATRFAILRSQGDGRAHRYFFNALVWAVLLGLPFMAAGLLGPGTLLRWMGSDPQIVALGLGYTRIFLLFAPFFMINYIVQAFVRNDGEPALAMAATLSGSLFNIVFDYIFMFPMGLGLPGAALATAASPIVSVLICSRHFFKKESGLRLEPRLPSARLLAQSCQLGVTGFVGEISSGVTTTVFNFLLLGLAGNLGVAAYGVVANFALVATAIFNGAAQGAQPLISDCYGRRDIAGARHLLRLGLATALVLAGLLYGAVFFFADPMTALFNSEGSAQLAEYAAMFGMGKKTGIDLRGESSGLIASEKYKMDTFDEDWYLGDTFNSAIGQGFQLVVGYPALVRSHTSPHSSLYDFLFQRCAHAWALYKYRGLHFKLLRFFLTVSFL